MSVDQDESEIYDMDEVNAEIIECARYGEDEDLEEMIRLGGNVNHADETGNTALHKAAANGNVGCLRILRSHGANHVANSQGNLPIHWAAQNGQLEALTFLFENYEVDVLVKNQFGRSTLTEAFSSSKEDVIAACLNHPSSSEENLLRTSDKSNATSTSNDVEDDLKCSDIQDETNPSSLSSSETDSTSSSSTSSNNNAVLHLMDLSIFSDASSSPETRPLRVRELPISRADTPFGSESAPEDDTTGPPVKREREREKEG